MLDKNNGVSDEEIKNLDLKSEKTKKLMEQYKKETGKNAIWQDKITESFKKWLKGEKIYDRDKERTSLYLPKDTKTEWQDFVKTNENEISSLSDLIRTAVSKYIKDSKNTNGELSKLNPNTISKISHDLNEPLTSIKGFSQILFEDYKNELSEEPLTLIQNIVDQSLLLENRIKDLLDHNNTESSQYDILLIDDHLPTIRLLTRFFASKGYSCEGVVSGKEGIRKLRTNASKVVLLDIRLLNDECGYEICKIIKSDNDLKYIPVYLSTAIPGFEVKKHMKETQADGYILKPFNFPDFEVIFDILKDFKNDEKKMNEEEEDKEKEEDDNKDANSPYPYIFKPPEPPGDIVVATQLHVQQPISEEEPEVEFFCKYCGSKLRKEQKFCRLCKNIVE